MKEFLDWLLEQIGDAMLITATLAILNKIAKGWLEAYWPQNEDEAGTESESESETDTETETESKSSSVSETESSNNFMAQLAYSCSNFGVLLLNRKDTDKIYLSNIDIGIIVVHISLIRECLDRHLFPTGNETNTLNAYHENLKECQQRREINNIKCYELMDQLHEVLEIISNLEI